MSTFGMASGKYAKGICDRCGMKFKLNSLRLERRQESNAMVCRECYDPIPDNIRWKGPHARTWLRVTRPDVAGEDV